MFKTAILAAVTCLILAGCADGDAKKAVSQLLIDPDSAKFEGLTKGTEDYIVCGRVNAKNRMGGYVGFSPFFYYSDSKQATLVKPADTSDFRSYWLALRANASDEDFMKVYQGCLDVGRWNTACGNVAKI